MTVKEHYDSHLGHFYSWMLGDFEEKKEEFKGFCLEQSLTPFASQFALDLGAGHGIQSVALAELGYQLKAIDFSAQLLDELALNRKEWPIEIVKGDLKVISGYKEMAPELIVCCGDTIAHLDSLAEIRQLIKDAYHTLIPKGKLVLSFRDYAVELKDDARFIPVKSDESRILTCFLEYFPDKIRVTDLLHEKAEGVWQQKVSSYEKLRVSESIIRSMLEEAGFKFVLQKSINRMIYMIGQKLDL